MLCHYHDSMSCIIHINYIFLCRTNNCYYNKCQNMLIWSESVSPPSPPTKTNGTKNMCGLNKRLSEKHHLCAEWKPVFPKEISNTRFWRDMVYFSNENWNWWLEKWFLLKQSSQTIACWLEKWFLFKQMQQHNLFAGEVAFVKQECQTNTMCFEQVWNMQNTCETTILVETTTSSNEK